jgi:hypothetical protein
MINHLKKLLVPYMKKYKQIYYLLITVLLGFIYYGCNQEAAPSLYEIEPKGNTPVVSSVIPANEALAGVSEITINGSNFSPIKDDNFVYFGTAKGTVLEASSTKLIVKAPTLIKNQLDLKVAVKGVENFSNITKYNLLEAVGIYYNFPKGVDEAMTITVDKSENLFVSVLDKGIKKISSTGVLTNFAPKGGESFFFDLKMGPNNILYGTRNLRAIFQVTEGSPSATFVVFPTGISIISIDFDASKNIWASGGGGNIYSVTPNKDINAFPIDYTALAVRVFNGHLYVAGKKDNEEAIYRYKINSYTSLGSKELFFNIGSTYGLNKVQIGAMTFSEDGDLILGTNQTNAFILIKNGIASAMYTGLIAPYARSIAWGTKKNLFYVKEYTEGTSIFHSLIRVDMQKLSAPYYGRQ